ncbi:hypothetical protein RND81_04G206100 [Saponaria officinalis]|uniref:CMP/dCMP-type deaminase domain-containing protein n=1 Tax=Saponaria officinalis TaxID=3572 RepID=A0AAW1LNE2_SAPOF
MSSDELEGSRDCHTFMKRAIEEAKTALERLEVPVGCVIVKDGKVIASGSNRTNETRNATRHAEMEAIDTLLLLWQKDGLSQSDVAKIFSECVLYVTCEPCIMCAAALSYVSLFQMFYERGNPNAPKPHRAVVQL